jgi:hypothetical protein
MRDQNKLKLESVKRLPFFLNIFRDALREMIMVNGELDRVIKKQWLLSLT